MKNYEEYIKESISNVNKEYTEKLYHLFINKGYGVYKINLSNKQLPLYNLVVSFKTDGKEKECLFNENLVKLKDFFGVIVLEKAQISFKNFDIKTLKEDISHEIGHVQECFDKLIKNKSKSTHDIINHTIQQIRNKNENFDVFCDIIYNTTDNELNNKLNQIYYYLKDYKSVNKKFLKQELENNKTFKKIKEIQELEFEKLSYGLLNLVNTHDICDLINEFNKLYLNELIEQKVRNIKTYNFLNYKVFTNEDVTNYFLKWESLIKSKFEKWFKKLEQMIDKVITDITFNENYTIIHTDDNLVDRIKKIIN